MSSQHITTSMQKLAEGVTYGGGLAWLTVNSSAITAIAVVTTGIASIYFGRANKITAARNASANEERNKINKRDITERLITDLDLIDGGCYTADEIKARLRRH